MPYEKVRNRKYNNERLIFEEIINNENIIKEIKNIHVDNILYDLEYILTLIKIVMNIKFYMIR